MSEDGVEQNEMGYPLGVADCEGDGIGPGSIVTNENHGRDVEVVKYGCDLGQVFVRSESGWIGAIGLAVSEEVEGDSVSRRELRNELVVDAVIVRKAVHQDYWGILARNVAHEDAAVRRFDSAPVGEHVNFRHLIPSLHHTAPRVGAGFTVESFPRRIVSTPGGKGTR